MGLGKLGSLHPYVRDRLGYILAVADWYGGNYEVTSGFRTEAEQRDLIRQGKTTTAPGCSQHQYGLAADVKFANDIWQEWYLAAARQLGLVTVSNDPVHIQTFPGADFREWAVGRRFCIPERSFPHPDGQVVTNPDGSRQWVWNTSR